MFEIGSKLHFNKTFVPDFNPQIPFSDGVKEIVAWYKENTILSV